MRVKLIVRFLDASGALLAWAPLRAIMRGDGCLRAIDPLIISPMVTGQATELVLHWPDLHVQRREACDVALTLGVPLLFKWDIVWTFPTATGPLPAVTVGQPVAVDVPVGAVGAVAP
jgi:hypothetical protein